jgi:D-cysteine desulfhydrase
MFQGSTISPRVCARTKVYQNSALLFSQYPALKNNIPYMSLGNMPTPVYTLDRLADAFGMKHLWVKADNICGRVLSDGQQLYGGNKVRKLEFLLADACAHHAQAVVTMGSAGSNHAVATAAYARSVGLKAHIVLKPQEPSALVQRNLLLLDYHKATIHAAGTTGERNECVARVCAEYYKKQRTLPYVIPVGGSCVVGILGFVNAAFELKKQIDDGVVPKPDYVYVAMGTMGTVAGLSLGFQLAGLDTHIKAVAVMPERSAGNYKAGIEQLRAQTIGFLRSIDPTIPQVQPACANVVVLTDYCGHEYGIPTVKGNRATQLLRDMHGMILDSTYTAKACAGLLCDVHKYNLQDKVILFWNTFSGDDYAGFIDMQQYQRLPSVLHRYFESL